MLTQIPIKIYVKGSILFKHIWEAIVDEKLPCKKNCKRLCYTITICVGVLHKIQYYMSKEAIRMLYNSPINSLVNTELMPGKEQFHVILRCAIFCMNRCSWNVSQHYAAVPNIATMLAPSMCMLFCHRHISMLVFFNVCVCPLLVPCVH